MSKIFKFSTSTKLSEMSLKRAYFLLVSSNLTVEVNKGRSHFSSALCRLAVQYGCVFNYCVLCISVSILRRFQTKTMVIVELTEICIINRCSIALCPHAIAYQLTYMFIFLQTIAIVFVHLEYHWWLLKDINFGLNFQNTRAFVQ